MPDSDHAPTEEHSSTKVRRSPGALASVFTPSWGLGLLLFCCLFLPAYQGCNGKPIYIYRAFTLESLALPNAYLVFQVAWPCLFGLLVAIGSGWLLWTSDPQQAKFLWWSYSGLVIIHACLLIAVMVTSPEEWSIDNADEAWLKFCWLSVSLILLVLIPLTGLRCRTWLHAALWMQLSLGLVAALSLSFLVPALLLANRLLIGGKLMVFCSVFLVVSTLLQQVDGYRTLTRDPHHSPLRLSLRALLCITTLSGVAAAWVGQILQQLG